MLFSHRNEIVNAFEISYPSGLATSYDPIVARMSKSLRSGRGYQIALKRLIVSTISAVSPCPTCTAVIRGVRLDARPRRMLALRPPPQ